MSSGEPRATTEWALCGFGPWRTERGVLLRWRRHIGVVEVDATDVGGPLLSAKCTDETNAKAWCEKWALVVLKEIER